MTTARCLPFHVFLYVFLRTFLFISIAFLSSCFKYATRTTGGRARETCTRTRNVIRYTWCPNNSRIARLRFFKSCRKSGSHRVSPLPFQLFLLDPFSIQCAFSHVSFSICFPYRLYTRKRKLILHCLCSSGRWEREREREREGGRERARPKVEYGPKSFKK